MASGKTSQDIPLISAIELNFIALKLYYNSDPAVSSVWYQALMIVVAQKQ